jgi:hypothetical protein
VNKQWKRPHKCQNILIIFQKHFIHLIV